MSLNRKMASKHEEHLVERLGGRQAPGSGNQWAKPMDGRHSRYATAYAYAWEGKSTLGKSIGVSRAMIAKAREQARGERPMLALRWYDSERLDVGEDWVAVPLDDFEEMRRAALGED